MLSIDDLREIKSSLGSSTPGASEAEAIERLALLEEIKAVATAAQVRETVQVDDLRAEDEQARNVPRRQRGRGLAAEIGLARKASARKGSQYLGFARALAHEMPHTRDALSAGRLTEWRATILVRETAYLTRESREEIDRRISADSEALIGIGDRELEARAKQHAYELEPRAVVARKAKAEKQRRVSVRPAPDLMTQVSALLPMAQGVAVYASLKKHADSVIGRDDRSHAQIMADTLVERVTGQSSAAAVPVAVDVVMSEKTMLGSDDLPAEMPGYGPIPAAVARELIGAGITADDDAASTIRRLYARPRDGTLVSMDAKSRCFPKALAHFVAARDRRCRVPYCGAPVAEIDHAHPHRRGGATDVDNADGTCVDHNRSKEAGGWRYQVIDGEGGHSIEISTPTGGVHRSDAPPAVGYRPDTESPIETRLHRLLAAA